ncbi:hypothetical protein HPQ64_11515 [Rhizobiales bacterium]|uniref:pectate lyase family protein n=1 Tax=Hongsoonwoonella zoysiae TaxID=2821844 RepID=UPI00155F8B23|nr:hypothetical protein [Hongsoonwoonella zoysiae]NRG18317.1 hypothetical protein [Hongsoonwoonella zoysiae]
MATKSTLLATTFIVFCALEFPAGNAVAEQTNPAFQGAVGFGRNATGWRGGEVVRVTNLEDSGPGSLRACAEHEGKPRVCVFAVSGTIMVDRSIIVGSNTYIAGQTSPGDGVQLRLGGARNTALVIADATDVVVRYLKIRPGPSKEPSPSVDGILVESSSRVYLDHLSIQFATDENVSIGTEHHPTEDITVANSIIALGLDRANHPKGKHSKGALVCSKDGPSSECGRVSLIKNLFAHNRDRNPDIGSSPSGPIEIINNVFYNPTSQFGEFYNYYGKTMISYVGNVALPGPSTRSANRPSAFDAFPLSSEFRIEIFSQDNINLDRQRGGECNYHQELSIAGERTKPFLVDAPELPLTVSPIPSTSTLDEVLETAGARTGPERNLDILDRKIVDDVRNCQGSRIDWPDEAGGWPDLSISHAPEDGDKDGMPDEWELEKAGLDPENPSDAWSDRDGDGWSNLEEYLSFLAGDLQDNSR